jgi:6-phosphofructokinase 1
MAGSANRCVIPEHKFDIEQLTDLMVYDRNKNPSKYSIVLVSEGATFSGGDMIFSDQEEDMFGHKKLGGIGDLVSAELKALSPKFNTAKPSTLSTSGWATWCAAATPTPSTPLSRWPTATWLWT